MATNLYFNNVTSHAEQELINSLTSEVIQIHGLDVFYIPRTLVKEDVYIQWAAPPWIGDTWLPISSIEFKQSRTSDFPSSNIFSNKDRIDLNTLNLNSDFDFKPFRFSNTIGLQRIEYPND